MTVQRLQAQLCTSWQGFPVTADIFQFFCCQLTDFCKSRRKHVSALQPRIHLKNSALQRSKRETTKLPEVNYQVSSRTLRYIKIRPILRAEATRLGRASVALSAPLVRDRRCRGGCNAIAQEMRTANPVTLPFCPRIQVELQTCPVHRSLRQTTSTTTLLEFRIESRR